MQSQNNNLEEQDYEKTIKKSLANTIVKKILQL
jgi:hypothetical protein